MNKQNESELNVTPVLENTTGAAVEMEHEFIDVKHLIATLTDEELLESADQYWDAMNLGSEQCYKPFSNSIDPTYLTRHLSMLFQAAGLFPGAKVLDFGCATGWLTMALAEMGMIAAGVDISPKSIHLAEGLLAQRGLRPDSKVSYKVYKGNILPHADESFDRVVCFDSFHHVRDQEATLKEMARVLRPGGRIAMVEPSPGHSKAPASQSEMRNYKVIENDTDMLEIDAICQDLGLLSPMMILQLNVPSVLPVETYKAWTSTPHSPEVANVMFDALKYNWDGPQCFFSEKPRWEIDSRKPDVLGGEIELLSAIESSSNLREYILKFRLTNSGQAVWLAKHQVGQVNLGIQVMHRTLRNLKGILKDENFGRINLPNGDVQPGDSVTISAKIKLPVTMSKEWFRFDLVAENVAWFSLAGKGLALDWHP